MPGPYTATVDDADLATRAQSGDSAAWAAIYDRYADRLHDYCWSILRDHHEAEDALQDAFVTAAARIGQLRDPARLRPWLYAVCRTSALGRARRRAKAVPTEDVGSMSATEAPFADEPDIGELRQIVWDAAAGLAPRDRAVLELHLRHDLVGQDLAEALGVSAHHASVLLGRVRGLVERSLGALLVGRTGRRDCPDLDALLAGWDGRLSPLLRKRVARHIDGCEVCGERRRAMISPLALLAAMPIVPAPSSLRSRVLAEVERTPRGSDRPGRGRVPAAGAADVAVVVTVALLLANRGVDPVAVSGGPDTSTTTGSATTAVSTSTTGAPSVTAELTPGSTDPPIAFAATIVVMSGPVDFDLDTTEAVVRFRNGGNEPLAWTVTADLPGVTVIPSSGLLSPGSTRALTLTMDRGALAEGAHDGALRIASEGLTPGGVSLSARVERAPTIDGVAINRTSISFSSGSRCRRAQVSAAVNDESGVTPLLRWQRNGSPTVEGSTMAPTPDGKVRGFVGPVLSPSDGPITWWIEAADTRGNTARTPAQSVTVTAAC